MDMTAKLWYNSGMTTEDLADAAVRALEDAKGKDVKTYDVRGKSQLADFFIVATGEAAPHLKALASAARNALRSAGVANVRESGDPDSGWTVLDGFDIVVHVFSREARAYYALEKLWTA